MGWAIASLLLGCASLPLGFVIGIAAVVCGHIARSHIHRSAGTLPGNSVAFAGLITGYLGIFFGLFANPGGMPRDQARRAEARTAVVSITTALNAYREEYGKYPFDDVDGAPMNSDVLFGTTGGLSNARLFNVLRNNTSSPEAAKYNPRGIVFFDGRTVSDPAHPRSGFVPAIAGAANAGAFVDPWGNEYRIAIDANYDQIISNLPYADFQNTNAPHVGVAVFSLGKDGQLGKKGDNTFQRGSDQSDDIVSWH